MGKFFEKMYIGNPNKPDLTKERVQKQSRFQLVFTVIQARTFKLLLLNVMYALFLLPAIIVVYLGLYNMSAEGLGFESLIPYLYALFPASLIAMPGKLGFTNVLTRWANDEHAWVGTDFWAGIKNNWKRGLAVTIINYFVLLFLIYITWFYYSVGYSADIVRDPNMQFFYESAKYIAPLMFGFVFVYAIIQLYVFPMLVRYDLKVKDIYKCSMILGFRNFLYSVIAVILLAVYAYFIVGSLYMILPLLIVGIVLPYLLLYVHIGWVFNKYVYLPVREY